MPQILLYTLIHSCLAPPTPEWAATALRQLEAATDSDWQHSLEQLTLHRLTEHVFHSLTRHGLMESVRGQYRLAMAARYLRGVSRNRVLLRALDEILHAMARCNLHPVVLKGIVMADYFYPDPGTRPMTDIDIAFPAAEMEEALAAFGSIGYSLRPGMEGVDAFYLTNEAGVLCDVHYRLRLFEGKERLNLTTDVKPRHMTFPTLRLLEPNAMVVHLVVHMRGHSLQMGPLLCWFFDLAMVLRAWGASLERDRLEAMMPDCKHLMLLGRIVRFLQSEFDEKPPDCLAQLSKNSDALPLSQVLRQRRLKSWGLPGLKGWKRLLASQLGVTLKHEYPELEPSDLYLWIGDAVRDVESHPTRRQHVQRCSTVPRR